VWNIKRYWCKKFSSCNIVHFVLISPGDPCQLRLLRTLGLVVGGHTAVVLLQGFVERLQNQLFKTGGATLTYSKVHRENFF